VPRSAGKIATRMRFKAYNLVSRAVEGGLAYGITRLWKYHESDTMTEAQMRERQEALHDAVMGDLCEVIDFDTEP